MAKTYGISDRKTGSIGGLTYSMTKDGIVVKEKIVKNKSHTKSQVIQRCLFSSVVKAGRFITPDFLEKCFENKKRTVSYSNTFANKNRKNGTIAEKKVAKDPNVISFGNWQLSEGSLVTGIKLSNAAKKGDDSYIGIRIGKQDLDTEGNATVGEVSTALIANFPELREDMVVNMIAVDNVGVLASDDTFPVAVQDVHYVSLIKQNFIISKIDNTPIVNKGFTVVKGSDDIYSLLLLKEGTKTDVCEALKIEEDNYDKNVAFAGLVVTQTLGLKVYVQTAYTIGNWQYDKVIEFLKDDLNADQNNLGTYDIEQEAMIVDVIEA